MKIIAVLFILMLCCRLAASGGGGRDEMDGEEQGKHVDEKESRKVGGYPESNHVDNHHGIPRQYYHDWGSSPVGGDGGSNVGGGGGGSDNAQEVMGNQLLLIWLSFESNEEFWCFGAAN
ncbi:hypothetical protein PVL29_010088 [Vitis rotundifolia]|uniref:Glycine-rich protein n=1 Tax=Vitis rotundifolia TaxID=103349 RepID=A0AA38ZSH7_VITRO|nr:hypothetical protein PVL29_010088 [Vitis rotundifolia]